MSSFTEASFEAVYLADGSSKLRGGRQVYKIRGADGAGLRWDVGYLGSGLGVHVPEGFETDGPSAPLWLLPLLPVRRMVKASAVHDMLREDVRWTKLETDAIFLMAMETEGTPLWARVLAYKAVRLNRSRTGHQPPAGVEPDLTPPVS